MTPPRTGATNDRDVCVLYQGDAPHPAHRTFGDAVGATYRHFESKATPGTGGGASGRTWSRVRAGFSLPREFDVVIAEGSAPLQTALVYGLLGNRAATVIYLAADETFFTLSDRPTRHLWRAMRTPASHVLDGCISVGEMAYSWCCPYLGHPPYELVHPPIPASRYDRLRRQSPKPTGDTIEILSVGRADPIKNHAALVDAVGDLRGELGVDLSLTLVGRGQTSREYAERDHVTTPGYVSDDELVALYDRADLYVQPAIADAYPVATLEAMLSATPTVVTSGVGTAHRLPSTHVCDPSVRGLRSAVRGLVDTEASTRIEVGRRHRSSVVGLTESAQGEAFSDALEALES